MRTAPTYKLVSKLYKCRTPTSSENWTLFAHCLGKSLMSDRQLHAQSPQPSTASSCLSSMMSAKRCGLTSLLLKIKGPTLSFAQLPSFVVKGEFYFTSHFSGFLHGLTDNYWATKVASSVQWELKTVSCYFVLWFDHFHCHTLILPHPPWLIGSTKGSCGYSEFGL